MISLRSLFFCLVALAIVVPAVCQNDASPAAAPLPLALKNAKSVFVSNAGSDAGLFPEPFSGDQDRTYATFYADLKATGDFELVNAPSDSDLVLQISLEAPNGPSNPNKQHGTADPLPLFRLTVIDRPSHYILWTSTEPIDVAMLQKTHDRNFDEALQRLVRDFLAVSGHGTQPSPRGPMAHFP